MRNITKMLALLPVLCLFSACGANSTEDFIVQDVPEVQQQETVIQESPDETLEKARVAVAVTDNAMAMQAVEKQETAPMTQKQAEPKLEPALIAKQKEAILVKKATPEDIHSDEDQDLYFDQEFSRDGKF